MALGTRKIQANPHAITAGAANRKALAYVSQRGSMILSGKFVLINLVRQKETKVGTPKKGVQGAHPRRAGGKKPVTVLQRAEIRGFLRVLPAT